MIKSINISSEIESKLSIISRTIGKGEEELILEAIGNYVEEYEDRQDVQERLSAPPDRYWSLEEVEKELDLAD
jgi:predicted DNA-binding protein